jgi:LysM repeat protein
VRRRQTVYSIARRYDVSEEVIYRYNPQARDGIKVDQILLIPKGNINGTDPVQVTETVKEDVINDEVPDVIAPCSPAEAQTYNVALLLPLFTDYFRSLQSGNALQANTNTTQVQIPALSREFAEFYEGFLLAADSMRQAGMSVNLPVYDTDRDNSKIASIQKNMMSDNLI